MSGHRTPVDTMLGLLNGHCVEQALHVAARLGIADLLHQGIDRIDELARRTATDREALYRVLRMLGALDVFREAPGGHFALTPLGDTLRHDAPNSVRDRAIFYGAPEMWAVWGGLMHSVQTGGSAFEQVRGRHLYDFLAGDPEVATPFNRYMAAMSAQHVAALIEAYDFTLLGRLVDVGGGHGATLAAILRAAPALHGVLFDLAAVVAGATALDDPRLAGRCTRQAGDMNAAVPPGGDGYLIKWVLMDRDDAAVVRLLANCRQAMAASGRVIAVEMVLPPGRPPAFMAQLDVQMLMVFGRGRLRDEATLRALFHEAGLDVVRCIPTRSVNTVVEAIPRERH